LSAFRQAELSIAEKAQQISLGLVLLIVAIGCIGFAMLYSANKSLEPWALRQMIRFAVGLIIMFSVVMVDIRVWLKHAYSIYAITFLLLLYVEVAGEIGMGAQRWIDLKFIQLQPSEIMKVVLVLALARFFHRLASEDIGRPTSLIVPILLVMAPTALVLAQPDLGTAAMLLMVGAAMFFVAGVRLWKFAVVALAAVAAFPMAWDHLRDYQKARILTFLNPENDPQGAGYHILQSMIAFGSGGVFGKGYLQGTQSHLNFLPERQTDFIFTMLAEEFGMIGGLLLLGLYTMIFIYGFAIAFSCRNHFGRMLAIGLTANMFLYVFINMAMVMGLIPVVGIPLPMISYGGTAMITVLFGFGLLMSVYVNRDLKIGQRRMSEES
jgi:rod shape determining protein RodA